MAKRPGKTIHRMSPYKRYDKSPYLYSFKTCLHKHTRFESMPGWKGKVCSACNTITQGPKPEWT